MLFTVLLDSDILERYCSGSSQLNGIKRQVTQSHSPDYSRKIPMLSRSYPCCDTPKQCCSRKQPNLDDSKVELFF